jgi:hypothetical protein
MNLSEPQKKVNFGRDFKKRNGNIEDMGLRASS